jgi:hypothetical protein
MGGIADGRGTRLCRLASDVRRGRGDIHGPACGDELPTHLAKREGRQAWLNEAKQRLDRQRAERAGPFRVVALNAFRSASADSSRTADRAFGNREYAHYTRGVIERGSKATGSRPQPFTPPMPSGCLLSGPSARSRRALIGRTPSPKEKLTDPAARSCHRGRSAGASIVGSRANDRRCLGLFGAPVSACRVSPGPAVRSVGARRCSPGRAGQGGMRGGLDRLWRDAALWCSRSWLYVESITPVQRVCAAPTSASRPPRTRAAHVAMRRGRLAR